MLCFPTPEPCGLAEAAWESSLRAFKNLAGPSTPRPELLETDDASAQLLKVRQWALSLSAPRMLRGHMRGPSVEQLPELPPLKMPALRFVQRGVLQEAGGMQTRSRVMAPTPSSDAPVNNSFYDDPARPWPPRVSHLGSSSASREASLVMRGFQSSVAVEAVARADARRTGRSPRGLHHDSGHEAAVNVTTQSGVGKRNVQGADPMAGSLFSRDTVLDKEMVRHGLYEGQIRKKRGPLSAR